MLQEPQGAPRTDITTTPGQYLSSAHSGRLYSSFCGLESSHWLQALESTTICGVGSLARLAPPRPLQKRFRKTFLLTGTPRLTSVTVNRYATYLRLNGRISSSTRRRSLRTTRLHPFHTKTLT